MGSGYKPVCPFFRSKLLKVSVIIVTLQLLLNKQVLIYMKVKCRRANCSYYWISSNKYIFTSKLDEEVKKLDEINQDLVREM